MTDFDRLRRLPELSPAPGQAEAALVQVRSRRRRAAVRTAGAAGAAAVIVAIVSTTGPSPTMLEQTDEGVQKTATAVPSPTGHGGEADSASGPRLATGAGGAGSPEVPSSYAGGPGGGVGPTASPDGPPRPMPSYAPPRPRPKLRRAVQNAVEARLDDYGPPPSCTPMPGNELCSGIMYERADDSILFRITFCTGKTDGHDLEFGSGQEIDMVVRTQTGDEVWHWGRGQRFASAPHTQHLDSEECISWFLPWDYRDEAGNRLPAGTYRVEMPLLLQQDEPLYGAAVRVEPDSAS